MVPWRSPRVTQSSRGASSSKDTSRIRLVPSLLYYDLSLSHYTCDDPIPDKVTVTGNQI